METLLLYLAVMVVIIAVLYAIVWFGFGRSEDLPPLDGDTTLTSLPSAGITGEDVRNVRFQQTIRGYHPGEVDWTLEKLAREVDELRALVATLTDRAPDEEDLRTQALPRPSSAAESDPNRPHDVL